MIYVKNAAVVIGLISAIIALGWGSLGFPRIATAEDLERLNRQQLELLIPLTEDQLDRLIIRRGQLQANDVPAHVPEYQSLNRQIDRAQNRLQNARSRALGVSR